MVAQWSQLYLVNVSINIVIKIYCLSLCRQTYCADRFITCDIWVTFLHPLSFYVISGSIKLIIYLRWLFHHTVCMSLSNFVQCAFKLYKIYWWNGLCPRSFIFCQKFAHFLWLRIIVLHGDSSFRAFLFRSIFKLFVVIDICLRVSLERILWKSSCFS